MSTHQRSPLLFLATFMLLAGVSQVSSAHCDTMNGPVVKAARKALETRDLREALIWVRPEAEPEVRKAFEQALSVRSLGTEARSLADRYFFETVVRIHRAGEGAPFTGLKEGDGDVDPGIAMAEAALGSGNAGHLMNELESALAAGVEASFQRVKNRQGYDHGDVAAGREYVAAYVTYLHYVERLHSAVAQGPAGLEADHEQHRH